MVKPTVLQKVLNRPSQTYSFPQEKAYFSAKHEIARAAAETHGRSQGHAGIVPSVVERPICNKPLDDVPALSERSQPELIISGPTNFDTNNGDPDDSDDSDSAYDIFYTPNASPRTSMASTMIPSYRPSSPPETGVLATKTSLSHANISTTSISSSALDAHSLFSDIMSESQTTNFTTPHQSDTGHGSKSTQKAKTTTTDYTNQEWAKDVRWLVPTPPVRSTTTPKPKPRTDTKPPPVPVTKPRTKPNTPITKNVSKTTPSIMTSMTALLEDDELQSLTYVSNRQPRSAVLLVPKPSHRSQGSSGPGRPRMASGPSSSSSMGTGSNTSRPPHPSPLGPSASVSRRRSRSLGHGEFTYNASKPPSTIGHESTTSHTSSQSSSTQRTSKTAKYAYASSSADPYDPSTTSLPTFTPGSLPSQGTPGYTSLVLPRAPVPLSQKSNPSKGILGLGSIGKELVAAAIDNEGRVDLTKSGVAQTTMASVEVVKGLGGGAGNRKLLGLFRRTSTSSAPARRGRSQSEDGIAIAQNAAKYLVPESPLGFTSYRPPPRYIPSNSVLVQVWAVGVDSVDRLLVFGSNSNQGQRVQPGQLRSVSSKDLPTSVPASKPNLPSTQHARVVPKRTASLRSAFGKFGRSDSGRSAPGALASSETVPNLSTTAPSAGNAGHGTQAAEVGYIPGRSFVGRVLECGWEVDPDEIAKRGDWVVGLMDVKKSGALTEFVVVDRHRIHKVPHPHMEAGLAALVPSQPQPILYQDPSRPGPSGSSTPRLPTRSNSVRTVRNAASPQPLSLEELSLLPICGIAAYRAIRTFVFAFSSVKEAPTPGVNGNWGTLGSSIDAHDTSSPENSPPKAKGKGKGKEREGTVPPRPQVKRRRALVLGGHDGAGALAVQMLVKAGWRVCVHVPFSCLLHEAGIMDIAGVEHEPEAADDGSGSSTGKERWIQLGMRRVEQRVRAWGGEEVIFDDGEGEDLGVGPVVRVIESLREDGDVFDAVLDTVGGKEIWEASERLLKSVGNPDVPTTPVTPKANGYGKKERTGRKASEPAPIKQFTTLVGDVPGRVIPTTGDYFRAGLRSFNFGRGGGGDGERGGGKVGYAWINLAQDVDWEGENVRETLGNVLKTAVQDGMRPWVGMSEEDDENNVGGRVLPFERAPQAFIPGRGSLLAEGGMAVIKVAG